MDSRDLRARTIQESIRAILLRDWDPIGVKDVPEAQDEYDSYVGGVYRLLATGASESEIARHLASIERDRMGFPFREEGLAGVARRLKELDVRLASDSDRAHRSSSKVREGWARARRRKSIWAWIAIGVVVVLVIVCRPGLRTSGRREEPHDARAQTFVYILLPESIGPMKRGAAYEDDLEAALQRAQLGSVTGGGSQLGELQPDGTRPIEFCGIDVDLVNAAVREDALKLLRDELIRLQAPSGTELHYTDGESRLLDRLRGSEWMLRQARELLHPGFGY